jgi:amino-acid N-acetyltransferase
MMRIREATSADLAAVTALLASHQLPTAGVTAPLEGFLVAEEDGAVVGVIGLERYDAYGLLRSAAVHNDRKGTGVGGALVEQLLEDADAGGMEAIYLLTTTAEGWFPRFGFGRIPREAVPDAIRRSEEFTTACPASATVMVRSSAIRV